VSIEWIDPLMLGGTWMPELIDLAGGTPLGVGRGEPAPTVAPEALTALGPEVIVVKPCGFTLERTLSELPVLQSALLTHVPSTTRVYAADGNAFFNRPGPRLIESLEILAACFHPDSFPDFARKHARSVARWT
jgi:iron complex transport system substrate-binding protein